MVNKRLDSYSSGELEKLIKDKKSEVESIISFIQKASIEIGVTTKYVVHSDWMDHRVVVSNFNGFEIVSQDRRYGTDYEVSYNGKSVLQVSSEKIIDHIEPGLWQDEFRELMKDQEAAFTQYRSNNPQIEDAKFDEKYRMRRENESYQHDLEVRARHIKKQTEDEVKAEKEKAKRLQFLKEAKSLKL